MIYMTELCEKLQSVLDSENCPTSLSFDVQTVGFHLDHINNRDIDKNVIPVFVSSMGGSANPVKGLGQASYSIPISFYFPVRFKEDMFAVASYLMETYVGALESFGENSGKARSNVSYPTFGEIQHLDLNEFRRWIGDTYGITVNVTEAYMSMTMNLYLSSLGEGYLFGDDFSAELKLDFLLGPMVYTLTIDGKDYKGIKYDGYGDPTKTYVVTTLGTLRIADGKVYDDAGDGEIGVVKSVFPTTTTIPLTFATGSLQANSQADNHQVMGNAYTEGTPYATTYGEGFSVYVGNDYKWAYILTRFFNRDLSSLPLKLYQSISPLGITANESVYLDSVAFPVNKGQPMVATFSFGRKG